TGSSWVVAVNRGDKPDVVGRRLLEHYRPASGDAKAAQKLRRQDIKLSATEFARLDRDKDGLLDADEFGRLVERDPDLEFRVQLGGDAKEPVFQPLSKNVTGGARLWLYQQGAVSVALRLDLPGAKKSSAAAGFLAQMQATFKSLDRDKNGYLD